MISEKMRLKMLITELRYKLNNYNYCINSIRIIGHSLETVYIIKGKHRIKITEGYLGGNIIPILTCKDSELDKNIDNFVTEYKKSVNNCVLQSAQKFVLKIW